MAKKKTNRTPGPPRQCRTTVMVQLYQGTNAQGVHVWSDVTAADNVKEAEKTVQDSETGVYRVIRAYAPLHVTTRTETHRFVASIALDDAPVNLENKEKEELRAQLRDRATPSPEVDEVIPN